MGKMDAKGHVSHEKEYKTVFSSILFNFLCIEVARIIFINKIIQSILFIWDSDSESRAFFLIPFILSVIGIRCDYLLNTSIALTQDWEQTEGLERWLTSMYCSYKHFEFDSKNPRVTPPAKESDASTF